MGIFATRECWVLIFSPDGLELQAALRISLQKNWWEGKAAPHCNFVSGGGVFFLNPEYQFHSLLQATRNTLRLKP